MEFKKIRKDCEELWAKNKYYVLSKSHKVYLEIREYLKEKEVDFLVLNEKIQRDLYSAFLIKNVKENLEEVNIEKAQKEFKSFGKLHKEEIERIKEGNVKTLKCMGF